LDAGRLYHHPPLPSALPSEQKGEQTVPDQIKGSGINMEILNRNIEENKKIILFDGVCNLCNGFIKYVIKHDKKDSFRFASLQSAFGEQFVKERGINTAKVDSIILIVPNIAYYTKSTAALKIMQTFGGGWKLLGIFEWIPPIFRNWMYDVVAKRRYRWFGRQDECMVPTPELKAKFLE